MLYADQVEARALARLLRDVHDTPPTATTPPKPPRPSWRRLLDAAQRLDLDGNMSLRSLRRRKAKEVAA